MARTITDYTDIPTAGTRIQLGAALSLTARRITGIIMRADPDNSGNVAVGDSTVSMTNGFILQPGESVSADYTTDKGGSEELGYWWGDNAVSGDNVVWSAIVEK